MSPAQEVRPGHPLAGPNRPANVPANYVITPFGYFHPSCVLTFPSGTTLLHDGRVQHPDGSIDPQPISCAYPHFLVGPHTESTPTINGWVEDIDTTTTPAYGKLASTFIVPPAPLTQTDQTDYFFPGFQDTNASGDDLSILQPVLTWSGTGPWNVSSWNCCLNGTADQSNPVNVNTGDTIYGAITSTCSSGSSSCATWNVLSQDATTNKSTTLGNTPSDGQVWNWAFGAVLEAYSVSSCTQLPPSAAESSYTPIVPVVNSYGSITFNTTLYDDNLVAITSPGWADELDYTGAPKCGYKQIIGSSLKLDF
jgi:hypothetical protein